MRPQRFSVRHLSILTVVVVLSIGLTAVTVAQSQEPKPELPATPVALPATPVSGGAATGVSGSSWQGPNFGVRIHWDPEVWSVEGEFIDEGYDGLQIGTPISTVYLEAYDGFDGDAAACFAAAEQEIGEREGVSEVVPAFRSSASRRRGGPRGSRTLWRDCHHTGREHLSRCRICRVPNRYSGSNCARDHLAGRDPGLQPGLCECRGASRRDRAARRTGSRHPGSTPSHASSVTSRLLAA